MSEYGLLIDVTDTVSVSFTTGIQRVVKEFAARLVTRFPTVRLLRFCAETHQFDVLDNESFLKKTSGVSDRVLVTRHLNIEDIRENSCFLDLDSVWNSYHLRRQNLYKVLKEQGAKIGTLVYDIIPITYPQFCHADTVFHFLPYMSAVLEFSDFILVNTESTKEKVRWLAEQTGVGEKTIHVVPLGADFSQITPDGGKPVSIGGAARKAVEAGRYLFMMGTIEPRKNHKVLLDAFDRELYQTDINIVIAGRVGWNVEALIQRIKTHPQYNKRIFFVERPSDSDVKYLYDNAFAIVFASFEEGFGLPIMEAFHHKKMVFSSNADVLQEVGGDLAEYFDPKNPEELCRLVRSYLSEPQKRERAVARLDSCKFLSWEECTDLLADKLRLENIELGIEQQIRQIFVISARVEDLVETLDYWEHFLPFLTKVLVECPGRLIGTMRSGYHGRLALEFLSDEELLDGRSLPADHGTRNFFLRSLAMNSGKLDEVFLMADDDNRPLRTVQQSYFLKTYYKLYYYYDEQDQWCGTPTGCTSFDNQIAYTRAYLRKKGLSARVYASHMPQVIVKSVFLEMLEKYPDMMGKPIDEWSSYANYAICTYPDRFTALPYQTMCWPAFPENWAVKCPPDEYVFENFYRDLYSAGGLFEGISTKWSDQTLEENILKVQRRMALQKKAEIKDALLAREQRFYEEEHGKRSMVWRFGSSMTVPAEYKAPTDTAHKICAEYIGAKPGDVVTLHGVIVDQKEKKEYLVIEQTGTIDPEHQVFELNIWTPKVPVRGQMTILCKVGEKETRKTIPAIIYDC